MKDVQICRNSREVETVDESTQQLVRYHECMLAEIPGTWCPVMSYLHWLNTEHGYDLRQTQLSLDQSQCIAQEEMQRKSVVTISAAPIGFFSGRLIPLLHIDTGPFNYMNVFPPQPKEQF